MRDGRRLRKDSFRPLLGKACNGLFKKVNKKFTLILLTFFSKRTIVIYAKAGSYLVWHIILTKGVNCHV